MLTLILKLTHNTRFKDTAAVVRGAYRISEGLFQHPTSVRASSWMDQTPNITLEHQP